MNRQPTIKELDWLRRRSSYMSIRKIEQELNMPAATLHNFVNGKRGLDQQWHAAAIKWVKEFKK